MRRLRTRIRCRCGDENGGATVEFVFAVPLVPMLMLMLLESGLKATRSVMLERSVGMTVRDLRLGRGETPTHAALCHRICAAAAILPNCHRDLPIALRRVSTQAWDSPAALAGAAATRLPDLPEGETVILVETEVE